jgi:hypothetical protein
MARTLQGFEFVRNLAGFASNPATYKLTASESFVAGDAVTITGGAVTKVVAGTTANVLGVMAETVTAAASGDTFGRVHDNPLNVYVVSGTGVLGDTELAFGSASTIAPASATLGPLAVVAVNDGATHVVIKKHLLS